MLEILGFRKINTARIIDSYAVYVNKEIPEIRIEHCKKEESKAIMKLNFRGAITRYNIKDINNDAEVLSYLLVAVKDLGFHLGQEQVKRDVLSSLGIDKLVNDMISERMDNL